MENVFDIHVPTGIFRDRKVKVLEALVRYLHEEHQMNYSQIGRLLNRNPRTIWTAYQKARKKSHAT